MRGLMVFCVGLAMMVSGSVLAQTRTVPQSRDQVQLSFAPVVRQAAPAVVNIFTKRVVRQAGNPLLDDPIFRRFFGDRIPGGGGGGQGRVQNSLGSGVIVDPSGLIVTNNHVIRDADEITVVLADRREFEAEVVRRDERTDLAVLRIATNGQALPALRFRDSDDLEVGDIVIAIGNPFGVGQTVTQGIVSALARTAGGISDYSFFIQTDAAINPGNSGGALVTLDGRLVGINTAIYSRGGGSIGIGFAIPANMVRTVLDQSGRRVVRAWLGAGGTAVTAEMAPSLGLDRPVGVLIEEVAPESPAARAGLRRGDVVTAIAGRDVSDPESLRYRVATLPIGQTAALTVLRQGRAQQISVALQPPPETPPRDLTRIQGAVPFQGATVANLSPALVEEIGFAGPTRGVVVMEVERGSNAARVGLQPGDVLLRINGEPVQAARSVQAQLNAARVWRLEVRRGAQTLSIQVQG
ncbi:MAG: DegQ family serine endoprotease [Alphaproteobacteria bacterium]|nr:DegQ family serine endoprotease [Alphaproteobacteria bacterium]